MTTSIEKFRDQYPDGGLIADLVSIHDGQYIVRAAVTHQGIIIATGFATSVDVQIAEDKARDRALATLGLQSDNTPASTSTVTPTTTAPTAAPTPAPPTKAPPIQTAPNKASSTKTSTSPPPPTTAPPSTTATEPIPDPSPIDEDSPGSPPTLDAVPPDEDDAGPPIDDIVEEPAEEPMSPPSAAEIALENFNTSMNPVDLSDVIAQTDVELTRLGWTSVQGREYLEKTYNKRSRQQLTDEELMSFLLYLEEQ